MKKKYFIPQWVIFFGLCHFLTLNTFAQTESQVKQIIEHYDIQKLRELQLRFSETYARDRQWALKMANERGWPVRITKGKGVGGQLVRVTPGGVPIYYIDYRITERIAANSSFFNRDAAEGTRTDHLHPGGSLGLALEGQNMVIRAWESNIARATHETFDGPGGSNRYSHGNELGSNTEANISDHATHVMGTLIGSGVSNPSSKGMSPKAKGIGFNSSNAFSEMIQEALNGALIANLSFGQACIDDPSCSNSPVILGGYSGYSKTFDELMFNAPYMLPVNAAGNFGYSNNIDPLEGNSNYDQLFDMSTSKNNLVVANARDVIFNSGGTILMLNIDGASSKGPTDDLRIKPDITGNGFALYSATSVSDSSYGSKSGTSMAAPNVSGSLLLLQQHFNDLNGFFMRAATLKGLALHTADDGGSSGPDAEFGWGLLNTKRAAETISAKGNTSIMDELTLNQGDTYEITVTTNGTGPLMASISWTDRPGSFSVAEDGDMSNVNISTPVLVNDLDIRVTQNGNTSFPYALTGVTTNALKDNAVDPFERVDVANASGSYTITVTHKGQLTGGSQDFSLIVTGLSPNSIATTTLLAETSFETGWDNWSSGGNDAARLRRPNKSYHDNYSIRLRDDTGLNSSMIMETMDLSGFDQVELVFHAMPISMEIGENVSVRFNDGGGWATVVDFVSGTDFANNTFHRAQVTLGSDAHVMGPGASLAIQCNASENNDRVFVDYVTVTGITGQGAASSSSISIQASTSAKEGGTKGKENDMNTLMATAAQYVQDPILAEGFIIHPNPAKGRVGLTWPGGGTARYRIVDLTGRVVQRGKTSSGHPINISKLKKGLYTMVLEHGKEHVAGKLVIQ